MSSLRLPTTGWWWCLQKKARRGNNASSSSCSAVLDIYLFISLVHEGEREGEGGAKKKKEKSTQQTDRRSLKALDGLSQRLVAWPRCRSLWR